ncbi:MAG: endonuclease [Zetaproteobacteria bacterium]|nr:MAG: endonuclease [Zetaproteobacteria bacterium]
MTLSELYTRLFAHFGPQHWWPADTPFEVVVGAVLTQNTAWRNVERAIANLKAHEALSPEAIVRAPLEELARWIRPSGFFRQKAQRLQAVAAFVLDRGGMEALRAQAHADLPAARRAWLAIRGVGPETADSILLYAFSAPIFVIDAYTKRILSRLALAPAEIPYEKLQARFHAALPRVAQLFNEYHALFVALGKTHCRPRPRCEGCPLTEACPHFMSSQKPRGERCAPSA